MLESNDIRGKEREKGPASQNETRSARSRIARKVSSGQVNRRARATSRCMDGARQIEVNTGGGCDTLAARLHADQQGLRADPEADSRRTEGVAPGRTRGYGSAEGPEEGDAQPAEQ